MQSGEKYRVIVAADCFSEQYLAVQQELIARRVQAEYCSSADIEGLLADKDCGSQNTIVFWIVGSELGDADRLRQWCDRIRDRALLVAIHKGNSGQSVIFPSLSDVAGLDEDLRLLVDVASRVPSSMERIVGCWHGESVRPPYVAVASCTSRHETLSAVSMVIDGNK